MPLPASGQPISLNEIKTEFGAGGSRGITEFYANANGFVSPGTVGYPGAPLGNGSAVRIPSSGNISPLNFSGAGVLSGTAQTNGGPVNVVLPAAATWVAFKMVGGGGGCGGNDGDLGGSGSGGAYLEGILLLPEGAKTLVLYPGGAGASGGSGSATPGGPGGSGIALYVPSQNLFVNNSGANGSRAYTHGVSGAGGGGGGGSMMYVTIGGESRLIAVAGGGGGGGGAGVRGAGTDPNGITIVKNPQQWRGWYLNTNNLSLQAEAGFGPDRNPTTTPEFLNQGPGDDGGGGGGGGGPGGYGGMIPTYISTDPKDGLQYTIHRYDTTAGGGWAGAILTNQNGAGAFGWYTNSGFPSTTYLANANGPGNGAQRGNPGFVPSRGGAISLAWSTQTAIPTNGLTFVPTLIAP